MRQGAFPVKRVFDKRGWAPFDRTNRHYPEREPMGLTRSGFGLCACASLLVLAACGQNTAAPSPPPVATAFAPAVEPVSPANTDALNRAFEAAYGRAATATVSYGAHRLMFTPSALIDLSPSIVALIANGEGNFTDYDCASCTGVVRVDYLRRTSDRDFTSLGHWDLHASGVSFGLTAPWRLRTDLDNVPVLLFVTDESGEGCASTHLSIVALTAAGAVDAGTSILNSSKQVIDGVTSRGDYQYRGALSPLTKGQSFAIDYSGTAVQRVVFTKGADGKFESPGGGSQNFPPVC
jgi:hypothetical protein